MAPLKQTLIKHTQGLFVGNLHVSILSSSFAIEDFQMFALNLLGSNCLGYSYAYNNVGGIAIRTTTVITHTQGLFECNLLNV